jgi:hypothetical protein
MRLERVRTEGSPEGPASLAVRGDAGAVEYLGGAAPALHWHRPGPGPGKPSRCLLLPGGKCWEEAGLAGVMAAEIAEAGDQGDAVAWQRLEELYKAMAADAAEREETHGK